MANSNLKTLEIHSDRCTGCRNCEAACASFHYGFLDYSRSRIRMIRDDDRGLDIVTVCVQCENKPCVKACPESAIQPNSNGTITIDDNCTNCNLCKKACPYSGPQPNPGGSKYIVCDLCGGDPQCVQWCPFDVIEYTEAYDKENDKAHRKLVRRIEKHNDEVISEAKAAM